MNSETKARYLNQGVTATRVATPSGIALAIFLLWKCLDKLGLIALKLEAVLTHVKIHGGS